MESHQNSSQELLKTIYKSQDKITQLIEGLDEIPQQSLKDYYVKLRMIIKDNDHAKNGTGYESVAGEKKEIELVDLFENTPEEKSTKNPQKLLIMGGAGVGKSTLMQYIAFRWSNNELWENRFDYLYQVSLKVLLNPQWKFSPWAYEPEELNDSLLKCLVHYTLTLNLPFNQRKNITTAMLPWIGSTKGRILLLLDGYDEIVHLQNQGDFKTVMDEIFEFDNLILTSRPNAIKPYMRANFDRVIESTGLDERGIEQYFDRYFPKEHETKKKELRNFLDTHRVIKEICKIPVNIAMLCYIWLYSESNQRLKEISNISTLYQVMFDHLGLRYLQKKFEAINPSQNLELEERSHGHFDLDEIRVLTHVAYKAMTGGGVDIEDDIRAETLIIKGTHQNKEIVDLHDKKGISLQSSINYLGEKSHIKNAIKDKVTIKQVYKYGLLKTEGETSVSAKSDPDLEKQSFSFIHLTFQEFCTAAYLKDRLQKGDDQERNQICKFLSEHRNEPRYAMTLKFMAGIIADDQSRDNDIVVKLFWDAMVCNVDGLIELGIEAKVSLILSLLGEAVIKKDGIAQVDPRIPKRQQVMNFVDAVVLSDMLLFTNQLMETSYLSENIKAGIFKLLAGMEPSDCYSNMQDIADVSEPALALAIKNMAEKTNKFNDSIEKYVGKSYISCAIDLAINLIGKIKENSELKNTYEIEILRQLSYKAESFAGHYSHSENSEWMEKVLNTMTQIISERDFIDGDFFFSLLVDLIPIFTMDLISLQEKALCLFTQAFSKITDSRDAVFCMLKFSSAEIKVHSHQSLNKYVQDLIEQEKHKDYITDLIEYTARSDSSDSYNSVLIEFMCKGIDSKLALRRIEKVKAILASDQRDKSRAIVLNGYLISNLSDEKLHFEYLKSNLLIFFKTKNKDSKDKSKEAICGCVMHVNYQENYDRSLEYVKELILSIPKKHKVKKDSFVVGCILHLACNQNFALKNKIWKEIEANLKADQSDTDHVTGSTATHENKENIQFNGWRAQFFEIIKNIIDAGGVAYQESKDLLTSDASVVGSEKSFEENYEKVKIMLSNGNEMAKIEGIIFLEKLIKEINTDEENVEKVNRVLKDIIPLIRDKSLDVMRQAFMSTIGLSKNSHDAEIDYEIAKSLILLCRESEIVEIRKGIAKIWLLIGPIKNQELYLKSIGLIVNAYMDENDPEQVSLALEGSYEILKRSKIEINDASYASEVLQKWILILKQSQAEDLIEVNLEFMCRLCYFAKNHELMDYICEKVTSFVENDQFTFINDVSILSVFTENERVTQLIEKIILLFIEDPKKLSVPNLLINFLKYSKNKELVAQVLDVLTELGAPVNFFDINRQFLFVVNNIFHASDNPEWEVRILNRFISYLSLKDLNDDNDDVKMMVFEFVVMKGMLVFSGDKWEMLDVIISLFST